MPTNQSMQDDPLLKIPAAVRAQAERADQLMAMQAAGEPIPVTVEEPAPIEVPTVTDPVVADPTPQPSPVDENSWEHKYKSMLGRYNAEARKVGTLEAQVANLENVLAAMTTATPAPAPGNPEPRGELSFEGVTREEENDYGEDLLKVVGKKAMTTVAPILQKLQDKIDAQDATIRSLTGQQAKSEREKLHDFMGEKIPNWLEINNDDEFIAWLALPDAFSGVKRHDMLKEAYAANNSSRVLAFFNGYLAEARATAPAAPQPDPGTTQTVPKIPLASLAAPGKAKAASTAPGAEPEKPIITRAEIANFYAEKAAGKWRGREVEADAVEKMIFAAQGEGRIR